MKPKRRVDSGLLEAVRSLPCLACSSIDPVAAREAIFENQIRSHPHHVIPRGAGGGDVAENIMPLCFNHHREVHSNGLHPFAYKYAIVRDWLLIGKWLDDGQRWLEPDSVHSQTEVENAFS